MPLTLQQKAQTSLEGWHLKLVNTVFKDTIKPTIILKQRGRIAGAAVLRKNIITLQPQLFEQNQDYYMSNVIPHELAHLVVFQYFGRVKPHGKEWQHIMQSVFDISASVTHTLDVEKAGVRMFEYQCACAVVKLSLVRHNKVVRAKQQYICRKCQQTLTHMS